MGLNLTAREQELITLAFQSMETEPKINYARFAELSNLKVNSATTAWSNLRKKLLAGSSADGAGNKAKSTGRTSTPKTPSKQSSTKKSAKRASSDDDDEGEGAEGKGTRDPDSPLTAKRRRVGAKSEHQTVKVEQNDDEENI